MNLLNSQKMTELPQNCRTKHDAPIIKTVLKVFSIRENRQKHLKRRQTDRQTEPSEAINMIRLRFYDCCHD
jgi:hypothetical protein